MIIIELSEDRTLSQGILEKPWQSWGEWRQCLRGGGGGGDGIVEFIFWPILTIMDFAPSYDDGLSLAFQRCVSSPPRNTNPNHPQLSLNEPFEIFDWYPQFKSCHCYFLDHAQHSELVQAVAALINIALPFQKQPFPVLGSSSAPSSLDSSHSSSIFSFLRPAHASSSHQRHQPPPRPSLSRWRGAAKGSAFVSLTPYLRRLIATGFDTAPILRGFFGDSWPAGIGPLHEIERRNYLFAAKSANWLETREGYDIGGGGEQTVPFLTPLKMATEKEIGRAEEEWSEWLGMQDWMVGERGIEVPGYGGGRGRDVGLRAGSRMGMGDRIDEEPEGRVSRYEVHGEI